MCSVYRKILNNYPVNSGMQRSKFKWQVLLPIVSLILVVGIFIALITRVLMTATGALPIVAFIAIVFFVFIICWLVFGEIRTKMAVISIHAGEVSVTGWMGAGTVRRYRFEELEGYRISFLPAEYNYYEYCYLYQSNRKVMKLSSFYHQNYKEIKAVIAANTKDLGEESFNLIREVKEIFQ